MKPGQPGLIRGLRAAIGRIGLPGWWVVALGLASPGLGAAGLTWETIPGGRAAALPVAAVGTNGWQRVDPGGSGVVFTNRLSIDRFTTNQIHLNGSGVGAGDLDGDGWTDLVFAGLGGGSTVYRNRGGWRFEDITGSSGVAAACRNLDATGVLLSDVDGDGDLDLLVNSTGGGTHVLYNDGAGRFQQGPVLNPGRGGTSLALADLDGDGDLDLYVANYRPETLRDQPRTNFRIERTNDQFVVRLVNGRPANTPELEGRFVYHASGAITENGEPDALFRNEGGGRFVPLSFTDGTFLDAEGHALTSPLYEWGLSVLLRDLTGDGRPDIYVCNDFGSVDRFWVNQGEGRFRAAPALALRNTSKFSMGVDAADIDRDGHDDLYVLDMMSRSHAIRLTRMDTAMDGTPVGAVEHRPQLARSTLQWNRGDGTFAEIAAFAGLEATEWSWVPLFVDVDLDGYEDVLVATGHARDDMHLDYGMAIEARKKSARMTVLEELGLRKATPAFRFPCLAFRNRGDLRFEEVPGGWGCGDVATVSQGTCLADLDNDGDLDVAVNRMNDGAGLYRNTGIGARVAVRLKGRTPNTRGIGARIEVFGGAVARQSQEMVCGGRYLSGDEPLRVFAAGEAHRPMRIEVRWRDGKRSVVEGVRPNHVYEIDETTAVDPPASAAAPAAPPMFIDASDRIGHRHHETLFDDFERQPLLSRRLSQAGPGVGWIDLNGDGRDDLVVASGRGGRTGLFLNAGAGDFQLVEPDPAARDQVGVAGWAGGGRPGAVRALVASTGYEEVGGPASVLVLDQSGAVTNEVPLGPGSVGPLALADMDGDGDLDLFTGGTAVGGRYPEASPSRIFDGHDGGWRLNPAGTAVVAGAGLVSGAVWSDLNGDGFPELVLACEWGPVRVFRNERGTLREATAELGLAERTGWWTGVGAGDVDGDGRLDLVAGNWGLNSGYRPTREHPIRLYHGDLAGLGQVELVEATQDPMLGRWLPDRDLRAMARQLPWVQAKYPSHEAYARAGVEDLLAGRDLKPGRLDVVTLATTVFLNRGDRFEARALPTEAQLAPVAGITLADFDVDGRVDLFLAQNFHAVSSAISRQDAGRGLLLLGQADGSLRAVRGDRSGLLVYGEQRGSAWADYDADGRPDLVVTQNGAATRLFRNHTARAGIRLRLRGPAGNPQGIGAVVRVWDAAGVSGPAWEVHGGGGYGSQDTPLLIVPRPAGPAVVEIRWPGGGTSRHPLPAEPIPAGATLEFTIPTP